MRNARHSAKTGTCGAVLCQAATAGQWSDLVVSSAGNAVMNGQDIVDVLFARFVGAQLNLTRPG